MTAPNEYLPLFQEQNETAQSHTGTYLWATWKAQVASFISKNGLLLVICSQFFFAAMNFCVKLLEKLDPPTPTLEVLTVRMGITLFCCMIYTLANKIPDPFLGPKGVRGLLVARGLSGFVGMFGTYYALNYLPIADTTVLTFLSPFTVALAGHFFLGETYTTRETLAAVFSLFGVVLIARPPFLFGDTSGEDGVTSFERLRAIGSALLAVAGMSGGLITTRAIGSRAHPMQIITFFSLSCFVVGCAMMVMVRGSFVLPTTRERITPLLVLGLLSVTWQYLLTWGLRYETATRCALAFYTQLLFAVVLEFVAFGTVPSPLSAAGAAIITVAQVSALLLKQDKPSQTSLATDSSSPEDLSEDGRP